MICSGDFGFYEKRLPPPISVTNKRSRRTEIEKMSNFRNLFCMVAFDGPVDLHIPKCIVIFTLELDHISILIKNVVHSGQELIQ